MNFRKMAFTPSVLSATVLNSPKGEGNRSGKQLEK